jgi:zinc protease
MTALKEQTASSYAARVQKVVTPLGLEAWLVEDYTVPLLAFDFAFKAGAAQDPIGKAGVAHMVSGLLDEGAGPYDSEAFHRALDDKAVEISFHESHDNFQGQVKTLARHVDAAFDLARLALCEPRFDQDAIERVRAQIIAGHRHDAQDPNTLAAKAFREAAFDGHAYGRPTKGDLDTIPAITRDDLVAFHRKALARDNLKIAAVGAIDAARLAALIDKTFAALPEKANVTTPPAVEPKFGGAPRVIDVDVPQTTIRFGLPGVPRHDPDYMSAVVLNHILGGGSFSARLFKEVREKRGLAYSVHSQMMNRDCAAQFTGGTSTKNERAAESLAVIQEEIDKLRTEGPTPDELEKAKKYLIGSYALRFDTSTKIASHLVAMQTDGYAVEFLDERNGRVAAVTLDDVKAMAKRLFENKSLLVAAAGRPQGF